MHVELQNPAGLWLLSLAVPLVLLYVLKVRRSQLRIPSIWLWQAAERDLLAKHPFRRLVLELPLVLELLALLALAVALARPSTRSGALIGDHLALVVDTSASMSAHDAAGRSRMELGRDAARRVVRSLAPTAQAMVIEAGREPRVVSPLDRDRRRLESAIARLETQDVEGQLGRAIALASDRLRRLAGSRRIVVVSDDVVADANALSASALPIDVVRVGQALENAAILRIDVRSGTDPATRREQVQVFALVANFGTHPRSLFVTLRQRNVSEPVASRKIDLAPGERAPVVLTFDAAPADEGTGLVVELSPNDAMTVDDRAFGRVPPSRKLTVVMAPANGSPWLQRALRADPDVELVGTSLAALPNAGVPPDALVVIDGACPSVTPGADVLVLNPPAGECRTVTVGGLIDHPEITSWSEVDPRLRFLTLDDVGVQRARRIEAGPREVLVGARQGAIVADVSSPGRAGTLVSFDVGESTWPLKASFVLFVRNVVEFARAHRQSGVTGPARTGEPLSVRVPIDVDTVMVEGPTGEPQMHPARQGISVVPDISKAGFYFVSWQGQRPGSVLCAANLASESESNAQPSQLEARGAPVHGKAAADVADGVTDFSWLFAAIALGLVAFEVYFLTRARHVKTLGRPSELGGTRRALMGDAGA